MITEFGLKLQKNFHFSMLLNVVEKQSAKSILFSQTNFSV